MLSVIGIHSGAIGGSSAKRAGGDEFTAGHAWLSLHYTNGNSTTVGLWAEGEFFSVGHLVKIPAGFGGGKFEVCFGEEQKRGYRAKASRYYGLYQGQQQKAIMALGRFASWRAGHTCASWATEKMSEIFGISLASKEFGGLTNTPRALGTTLMHLNAKQPNSVAKPVYLK